MILWVVRIRSLDVCGIAEDDGSLRHRPLPQYLFWERLVPPHFPGLAAREARLATPYGQDRHGLHSANAPLRLHQTCRERGKASP